MYFCGTDLPSGEPETAYAVFPCVPNSGSLCLSRARHRRPERRGPSPAERRGADHPQRSSFRRRSRGLNNTSDTDIDAPEAWELTTGNAGVVVAVVDTGITETHADLAPNVWRNAGEMGGGRETNGLDDDANGYVDDWRGWDFVNNDNNPVDDNGHGTHLAGTIGARGNDSFGVAGVNWTVQLMSVKAISASGSGTYGNLAAAVAYASRMGARVVNLGFGCAACEMDAQVIKTAVDAAPNTLFVAMAGNGSSNQAFYPCAFTSANIICVAAATATGTKASFSNYGPTSVDLAAPGVGILSSSTTGGFATFTGASMATAHVTGVAALGLARNPTATAAELKAAILGNVDLDAAWTAYVASGGRLNAHKTAAWP